MDKNKIIEAATKFVQKGQYDKAIKEYVKLLDADPKDSRILQKVGELYQKKGDNAEAANYFLKVGESYSADGFFLKAVAVYKQVLKLDEKRIDVNLKLAELYQQLGLMSDAMAQLQLVAAQYEKSGDGQASLDLLKRMVELDPDNIASRIKLAELYARDNIQTEAVNEFSKAAQYLKRNNRVDDYIKVAERLVFLDANNTELARELAQIYLAKQDTKRALAKLQLCFKADPRDVETLNLLAQAFLDLGQTSKTISVYKELAKIYDEQDKVDEERGIWEKIREIAPDDPEAERHLAPPAAASVPERVAAVAPAARPASVAAPSASLTPEQITKLLTETDVYVKYGLHDKALEHLRKVFASDPNNLEAHDKAYQQAKAAGQPARAEEELATVIRLAIEVADYDRARARLQLLLEANPNNPEVPGFLEVLGSAAPPEEVVDDSILIDSVEAEVVEEQAESIEPMADDDALAAAAQGDEEVLASGDDGLLASSDEPLVPEDEPAVEVSASSIEDEALLAAAAGEAPRERSRRIVTLESSGTFELLSSDDEALVAASSDSGADEALVAGGEDLTADEVMAGDDGDQSTLQYADVSALLADEPASVTEDEVVSDEIFEVPGDGERDPSEITSEQSAVARVDEASFEGLDDQPVARAPSASDDDDDSGRDNEGATRVVNLADLARADEEHPTVARMPSVPAEALRTSASIAAARPASRGAAPGSKGSGKVETKPTLAVAKPRPPSREISRPVVPAPVEEFQPEEDPAGDELEEAAFFISQGDLETARDILETVRLAYPGNARARELMDELELKESSSESAPVSVSMGDQSFDLAAELAEELGGAAGEAESQPLSPGEDGFQISHEDVFSEFKRGVSKVVKPEDGETHYDLGVAYKEMGLTMDAVSEFEQAQAAVAGKPREVDCHVAIAACKRDLGDDEGAIEAYRAGLALPQVTPEGTKAMIFEIATSFESMNQPKKALANYMKVASLDPKYRDAAGCVKRLQDQGISPEDDPPPRGGGSNGVHVNGKKAADNGSSARPASGGSKDTPPGPKPGSRKIGYV